MTKIEWTRGDDGAPGYVWNPVTGCTKVSQGCKNCYAEGIANRRLPHGGFTDRPFTEVRCHPERLQLPLKWRKPRRVFVNSMSDLFHEDVPDYFIDQVFAVMALAPQHTFQVLTKRPERMRQWFARVESGEYGSEANALQRLWDAMTTCAAPMPNWVEVAFDCGEAVMHHWPLPNVWLGVSVEDQATADERIPILLQMPAAVRFVSAEPLLGPVDFSTIKHTAGPGYFGDCLQWYHKPHAAGDQRFGALDWIIVGGESGPGARPCNVEWIRSIVDQCKAAGTACFVKQLGANSHGWCFGNPYGDEDSHVDCQSYEASEGGYCPAGKCCMRIDRKGALMEEWPEDLQVRIFPHGR